MPHPAGVAGSHGAIAFRTNQWGWSRAATFEARHAFGWIGANQFTSAGSAYVWALFRQPHRVAMGLCEKYWLTSVCWLRTPITINCGKYPPLTGQDILDNSPPFTHSSQISIKKCATVA